MRFGTISANELDRYVDNEKFMIVDLREIEEYKKGHIKGAVHIEYENIEYNKSNLPYDKIIVMYCDRGGLSLMAAKRLSTKGYRIISVIGGMRVYHGKNLV